MRFRQNSKYKCPVFYGLIFCGTGMSKKEKAKLKKKIEMNGGVFGDTLEKDITTHLIVNEEKLHGEKYNKAKEWKVEIVTLKWLQKCPKKAFKRDKKAFKRPLKML